MEQTGSVLTVRSARSVAGDELLVFIEVQRGDYFGEDDIKRLADDFGRADAPRAKKKTGHPSLR